MPPGNDTKSPLGTGPGPDNPRRNEQFIVGRWAEGVVRLLHKDTHFVLGQM